MATTNTLNITFHLLDPDGVETVKRTIGVKSAISAAAAQSLIAGFSKSAFITTYGNANGAGSIIQPSTWRDGDDDEETYEMTDISFEYITKTTYDLQPAP